MTEQEKDPGIPAQFGSAKPIDIHSAIRFALEAEEQRNIEEGREFPLASNPELKPIEYCIENLTHDPSDPPVIDPATQRLILVVCPPCAEEKCRIYKREQAEKKEMDVEQPELPFE